MAGEPRARGELDLAALRARDRAGLLARIDRAVVWELPVRARLHGLTHRDGVLLHGPAGWGEVAPFWDYAAAACAPWLAAGIEQAAVGLTSLPVRREQIAVDVDVPEVDAYQAHALVSESGATTAEVRVASSPGSLNADLRRLSAVRSALGPFGRVRIDLGGAWDLETALHALPLMDRAAGGLEYAEQPCASVTDLAVLRRRIDVPNAADESVHLSADPLAVKRLEAADVVVLKTAPLGGVRRALVLAERLDLPAVVCSSLDTSVGVGAGIRLAAALPVLEYACGLGTVGLLSSDVAIPSVLPVRGFLPLRPVHVSETMLAAAGADDDLTARWATRLTHILAALTERREQEAADRLSPVAGLPL